jgi:hypothetical protein
MTDDPKVVPITPSTYIAPVKNHVHQDVVAALEAQLADARAGNIQGFAFVAITPEGARRYNWHGGASAPDLMAAIAILQFEFMLADRRREGTKI